MKQEFNKICVVGLGYIGLPTAATFAAKGYDVIGLEVSQRVVDTINKGEAHIVEPDLDMLVKGAVNAGRLKAVMVPEPADVFILSVPTPIAPDKNPDSTYIHKAVRTISQVLEKGNLIILESTAPVGSTRTIVSMVSELRKDLNITLDSSEPGDLHFVHCPERVLPGKIITELIENDRIIGGFTPQCAEIAADLYSSIISGEILITDDRTAEMAKLVENAYRDVNIAFANELSVICDEQKINVWSLIKMANRHPRVNILQPGPGVGGHCIAIDPWFIVSASPEKAKLISTARKVNDDKPHYILDKITKAADRFKKPVIACLGLAFKANIDDLRESPAIAIVQRLAEGGNGKIIAVEPFIDSLPESLVEKGISLESFDQALQRADIVVLLVDHKQFKKIDSEQLQQKIVIDTRGIWQ